MTYVEFREAVRSELASSPAGLTWRKLNSARKLPCERPCPTWVRRLEIEIGLRRVKGSSRALTWTLEDR